MTLQDFCMLLLLLVIPLTVGLMWYGLRQDKKYWDDREAEFEIRLERQRRWLKSKSRETTAWDVTQHESIPFKLWAPDAPGRRWHDRYSFGFRWHPLEGPLLRRYLQPGVPDPVRVTPGKKKYVRVSPYPLKIDKE